MSEENKQMLLGIFLGMVIMFVIMTVITYQGNRIIVSGKLDSFDNKSFTIDYRTYHCRGISNSTFSYYLGKMVEITLIRNNYGGFDLRATKEL